MNLHHKRLLTLSIYSLEGWIPSSAFLLQWAGPLFRYPLDRVQLVRHLKRMADEMPDLFIYKAIDLENELVIGHGKIGGIDYKNNCGTLCRILIGPPQRRGKGLGVHLVKALLKIAFEQLALHRVDLYIFDFNNEAIRCYEASGFKKEGLLREARRFDNGYWSSYIMGILEHEWRDYSGISQAS